MLNTYVVNSILYINGSAFIRMEFAYFVAALGLEMMLAIMFQATLSAAVRNVPAFKYRNKERLAVMAVILVIMMVYFIIMGVCTSMVYKTGNLNGYSNVIHLIMGGVTVIVSIACFAASVYITKRHRSI